ncbi:MAG: endolytic transglycosylase MltG [Bacteroidales bacterium]|nr:endolytic transglycosylase MltG [Bacteroidales bacterium]
MKKKQSGLWRIVGIAVLAVVFFGALQAWGWLRNNRLPAFYGDSEVYVQAGTTPDDVIAQIKAQGGIRWEQALREVFRQKEVERYITPGHYRVKANHSCVYVARMLNNSWQTPIRLTIGGGVRLKSELAASIGRQMRVDSADVAKALDDEVFLRKFGSTPADVYAMIIPDTYEIYWDATLTDIFTLFKKEHDKFWNEDRKAKAKGLRLSPAQVSILASIVACESNHIPEYPQLAGVYINRYRKGMRLQACPTVAYCFDFKPGRILKKHLQVNSPYNTYTRAGLPPGPICFPSKAAIDAVLNADIESGYLYFCASTAFDGTNVFSKTYSEHQKKARAYQRALDALQKKK